MSVSACLPTHCLSHMTTYRCYFLKLACRVQILNYHDFTETYPGDAILANNSATEANIVDILETKIDKTAVKKLEKLLKVQHVFQYMVSQGHFVLTGKPNKARTLNFAFFVFSQHHPSVLDR